MDLFYEYIVMCTHSANTQSLDVDLLQRQTHYVDKLEKVPSFEEVYIWTYSMSTVQCGHILQTHSLQMQSCFKTDTLCGQIGESSLLCRGVSMDLFYKHTPMWSHSVNTLSLDVELLQRQTCYVDKLEKVPSFAEVYIWTCCMNTMQYVHIL